MALSSERPKTTDVFAILCFATGTLSLYLLPIVLCPVCLICSMVSRYRLKENPNLKGGWLRIIGSIFGVISLLYLFWLYDIGPFAPR
jgi:hypothetical protein